MSAMRQPRHVVARRLMSGHPDVMSVIMASESLPRDPLTALRVVTESEHELGRIPGRRSLPHERPERPGNRSATRSVSVVSQRGRVSLRRHEQRWPPTLTPTACLPRTRRFELAVDEVRAVRRGRRRPAS